MEVAVAIAVCAMALVVGGVLGLLAYDFHERRLDRKARIDLKEELRAAATGLSELHNKNAEAMRSIQDKVNAHGVALTMRGK